MSDSLRPHGILQARILEWIAVLFSRGSSQPRDQTQVSYIAGGFFTSWATRENPRIPKWVAYLFSSRSSQPRNQTRVSFLAGRFFTNWATWEALCISRLWIKQITLHNVIRPHPVSWQHEGKRLRYLLSEGILPPAALGLELQYQDSPGF